MDINGRLTIASITDYFLFNIGQTGPEIEKMREEISNDIENLVSNINSKVVNPKNANKVKYTKAIFKNS